MDTKLTGILTPGDTQEIREWVEKQVESLSGRETNLADIREELREIRSSIDTLQKTVDNIERILEKVSD